MDAIEQTVGLLDANPFLPLTKTGSGQTVSLIQWVGHNQYPISHLLLFWSLFFEVLFKGQHSGGHILWVFFLSIPIHDPNVIKNTVRIEGCTCAYGTGIAFLYTTVSTRNNRGVNNWPNFCFLLLSESVKEARLSEQLRFRLAQEKSALASRQ